MRWTFLAMVLLVLGGCASASERRFQFSQVLMGVVARVEVYAPDEASARAGAGAVFARIAALDGVMSDYRADSELMRLCEQAGGPSVAVSKDLLHVIDMAKGFSEASEGAFDITAGPLVLLWREARRTRAMPDPAAIAEARARVGYRLIVLDAAARTIRLAVPGMRLDLGGIGKGYAVSESVEVLRGRGLRRCLVALAGDIAAGDPPPARRGWRVAVEHPNGSRGMILLTQGAVSSSGDTQQFVEIGGVRYSHIVDPATGLGLTGRIGATVRAPDGATADALATAVCILGRERGVALVAGYAGASVQVFEPGD